MYGVGDSEGGFFRRVENSFREKSSGLRFANLGISGDTTQKMLARADEFGRFPGHGLVVILGCNDVPRDQDRSPAIRSDLSKYESRLRSLLPATKGRRSQFISSFPVLLRANRSARRNAQIVHGSGHDRRRRNQLRNVGPVW